MSTDFIFVYGLLKSMYDNEAALFVRKHAMLIGKGTFPGYVYDLGYYPGAVYDEDSPNQVHGELFRITGNHETLIHFLDEFENVGPEYEQPNEYRKQVIPVLVDGKEYKASCYIYNRNSAGLKLIESGRYENIQGSRI